MTRSASLLLVAIVLAAGCKSASPRLPRYIVSAAPLAFFGDRHPGICVAVDPASTNGVWWWDAGRTGCDSRSSGLMDSSANAGVVSRSAASGTVDVSFQIGLMVGGPRQIRLELRDGRMYEAASGLQVPTERRVNLEMPEMPPTPSRRR